MAVEQSKLETSGLIDGIIPGINKILKRRWDELLWDPEFISRDVVISGLKLPFMSSSLRLYVNDEGRVNKLSFIPGSNGEGIVLQVGKGTELSLQEYIEHASNAETTLREARVTQIHYVTRLPEGKLVRWGRYSELLGFKHGGGIPIESVQVWTKNGKLYCPEHREDELYSVRIPDENDAPLWTYCPREPRSHFYVMGPFKDDAHHIRL